jgi:hypothetical protein
MVSFSQLWNRVTRTANYEAYCLTCKSTRQTRKVRYVTQQTSKYATRRLEGRCVVCAGKTSRYVRATNA